MKKPKKIKYSASSLFLQGLSGHKGWSRAWRKGDLKSSYDVVIIGGGGHGLATAFYLAENHGIRNVAVLEKGFIGGGNVGRNTTIVRANYRLDGNTQFYGRSLKLWADLSHVLNYNVMFSPRGQLITIHSQGQRNAANYRANLLRLNGLKSDVLDLQETKKLAPYLDYSDMARFPIEGGLFQETAGTVRHDAVAWGYARGADDRGVDIIENCEVLGFDVRGGKAHGVQTSRGYIAADRVGIAVSGNTSELCRGLGFDLPLETHVLQACVTESVKPVIHHVVSSGATHFYVSQSDKGGLVFGGHLEGFNSYTQRGALAVLRELAASGVSFAPMLSKLRLLRHWGGSVDMTPDASPIMDKTPVDGLYLNAGWCYGGFKATPAAGEAFAAMIASDEPPALVERFSLDRFHTGAILDEVGVGPYTWRH